MSQRMQKPRQIAFCGVVDALYVGLHRPSLCVPYATDEMQPRRHCKTVSSRQEKTRSESRVLKHQMQVNSGQIPPARFLVPFALILVLQLLLSQVRSPTKTFSKLSNKKRRSRLDDLSPSTPIVRPTAKLLNCEFKSVGSAYVVERGVRNPVPWPDNH